MATNPPWLRGPVPGVIALLQPVAHSLIDCREDVETRLAGVTVDRLWTKPGKGASIGFHVRHAAGSIDRLLTYARGFQLSAEQLDVIKNEGIRESAPDTAEGLIAMFVAATERAMAQVSATKESELLEHREVGRGKLPSTVFGILVHAAEHTQRHIGQMSTTLKVTA